MTLGGRELGGAEKLVRIPLYISVLKFIIYHNDASPFDPPV